MITDLIQRRVSKRRDRFNPIYLLYILIFVPALLDLFFPEIDGFLGGDLYLFYVILIFGFSLGISFFQWRAWHNRWRNFATDMGLTYQSYKSKQAFLFQWPRIEGTYQGHSLVIERFTKGSGRYKKIYTLIHMSLRDPLSETVEIVPKSLSSGIRRSMAGKDAGLEYVQVGDEVFDRKLEVKSSSAQFVRNVLSSHNTKQGILEIRSQTRDLKIRVQGQELYYQERSNIMDMNYLLDVLNTLVDFLGYIDRYGR